MIIDVSQLPLVLTAEHVAQVLLVSKRTAYELMKQTDFPSLKIRRCVRVKRDAFIEWMNNSQQFQ